MDNNFLTLIINIFIIAIAINLIIFITLSMLLKIVAGRDAIVKERNEVKHEREKIILEKQSFHRRKER